MTMTKLDKIFNYGDIQLYNERRKTTTVTRVNTLMTAWAECSTLINVNFLFLILNHSYILTNNLLFSQNSKKVSRFFKTKIFQKSNPASFSSLTYLSFFGKKIQPAFFIVLPPLNEATIQLQQNNL